MGPLLACVRVSVEPPAGEPITAIELSRDWPIYSEADLPVKLSLVMNFAIR